MPPEAQAEPSADLDQLQPVSMPDRRRSCEVRLGPVEPADLGQQVIGSSHAFPIAAPRSANPDAAGFMMARLDGDDAFQLPVWAHPIQPSADVPPAPVTFAPTRAGATTLTFIVHWNDGQVEQRSLRITARARGIDDVPENAPMPAHGTAAPEGDVEPEPKDHLMHSRETLMLAAYDDVLRAQFIGVTAAEQEAGRYQYEPEPSLARSLAEIAIIMGTAAIAAVVSELVVSGLETVLAGGEVVESAVEAAAGAKAAKIANKAIGDGVADAIKSGVEEGMGAETSESASSEAQSSDDAQKTETDEPDRPISKDPTIDFFAVQKAMLVKAHAPGREQLDRLASDLGEKHPEVLDDLLGHIKHALFKVATGKTHSPAAAKQADATALQWLTFKARHALGAEKIDTPSGPQTVTNLGSQRGTTDGRLGLPSVPELANGLLELEVQSGGRAGNIRVEGARIKGVSTLIAQRMLDLPLRGTGIPIRLLVDLDTVITVDEAGRVRVVGGAWDSSEGRFELGEAQAMRSAERIVSVVLEQPLRAWGVQHVSTDDANDGGAR